ncbi:MAG: hypothetical protein HSCHL_2044 [Hydrogenibacillus schlegelii]|uniref:Prepilin type IV endopeptidase peptidase domain-containing protein n=1 Tax=Hydrogenibacillus schlegelii TaxID=1484 RepID=A0A2T5G439_HYDSH|nr:A24 family peptidase [Hydrogenibacillus schlegelii]PTQ50932.1 MAG: hypothetical protein HSCHL_2044 [Hydrogenibacillus schlegelii]
MMYVATVFVYLLFLAGVFVAGLRDARERRIPNKLNLTLFVLGLLHGFLTGQIGSSLLGAAFSFFLSILPAFIMRMPVLQAVGGGDIKLMTAVGAFYGLTSGLFWAFGIGSVLSVVYGIVRMARSGYLKAYVLLRPFGVLDVPEARVPFGSFLALGIMMYETIMFVVNLF